MGPYEERRLQRRTNDQFRNAGVDPRVGGAALQKIGGDTRWHSLNVRDAVSLAQAAQAADAAQGAKYGSQAWANDPNRYGSVASNQFPGTFGPQPEGMRRREAATAQSSKALQDAANVRTASAPMTTMEDFQKMFAAATAQPAVPTPVPTPAPFPTAAPYGVDANGKPKPKPVITLSPSIVGEDNGA